MKYNVRIITSLDESSFINVTEYLINNTKNLHCLGFSKKQVLYIVDDTLNENSFWRLSKTSEMASLEKPWHEIEPRAVIALLEDNISWCSKASLMRFLSSSDTDRRIDYTPTVIERCSWEIFICLQSTDTQVHNSAQKLQQLCPGECRLILASNFL